MVTEKNGSYSCATVTYTVPNTMWVAIRQCKSASSPHSYKFYAHHCIIPPVRLMDAAPLGGPDKGGGESIGKGNAGRVASVSIGKQGMTPNVRPDREIQHTSRAPPRYPLPALYSTDDNVLQVLSPLLCFISLPNLRTNYQKNFYFKVKVPAKGTNKKRNCCSIKRTV